jgi:hypothetical protein
MKFRSAFLLLPVLALTPLAQCSAQTAMLVDAPVPTVAMDNSTPPGESFSSSAMGVYPVQQRQVREKSPGMNLLDWSMIGAASALRVLDFTSTEKALTEPQYFHEAILPNALVKNKPAFAAFEGGTVALNYEAYRFLVHHNKRSLARVSQYMYVGVMTFQIAHNYQTLGQAPSTPSN